MKIGEILDEDAFGVPTPSPEEVAAKHNVSLKFILQQLEQGISVEIEHTRSKVLAREIALDHLSELPDYYTRLRKMEQE